MTTIQYPTQAQLLFSSADRNSAPTAFFAQGVPPYNDFVVSKNQNLLQGQFARLTLSEYRFPWVLPNITPRNNTFYADVNNSGTPTFITIQPGFYTGSALASAVQTALQAIPGGGGITVVYNTVDQTFTIADTIATGLSLETTLGGLTPNWLQVPSFLKTFGIFDAEVSTDLSTGAITTGYAPLTYTDYVDICSEQLTALQKVKDQPTTTFVQRQANIQRVFVCDNNSANSPTSVPGTYPFIIYRQNATPKVFRWEADRSVGQIDIQLYDMYGFPAYFLGTQIPQDPTVFQPLPTFNFQLTFLCSEDA